MKTSVFEKTVAESLAPVHAQKSDLRWAIEAQAELLARRSAHLAARWALQQARTKQLFAAWHALEAGFETV